MRDFLTSSQRVSIEQAHRIERDRKIGDRMKAVLWADKGQSPKQISELLMVDEQTVRRHIKDYLDNDKLGGGSGGSQGKLDEGQSTWLKELLAACDISTAAEAAEKARGLFGVKFSFSGMTGWLKAHGFSWKKSEPIPSKANPGDQDAFIAAYQKLKAGLKPHEALLFMDATHPSQATKLSHGWSIRGERKGVPTGAGRPGSTSSAAWSRKACG